MISILRKAFLIFFAGLLALAPVALTVVLIGWLVNVVNEMVGPQSMFGRYLKSLGLGVNETVSYLIGVAIILAAIFILGILVRSRIGAWFGRLFEAVVHRIPIVSSIYDMSTRAVSVVGSNDGQANIKDMKPVWAFFGGKPGAAVLALMPSSKPVVQDGQNYTGVLLPTAPVPFGGALMFLPSEWVEPAEGNVEDFISVYVSMGMTMPEAITKTMQQTAGPAAPAQS